MNTSDVAPGDGKGASSNGVTEEDLESFLQEIEAEVVFIDHDCGEIDRTWKGVIQFDPEATESRRLLPH